MHHSPALCRPIIAIRSMLIAQATIEDLVLLTQDRKLALYSVPILGLT